VYLGDNIGLFCIEISEFLLKIIGTAHRERRVYLICLPLLRIRRLKSAVQRSLLLSDYDETSPILVLRVWEVIALASEGKK
jgi:hypothetical protein